MEDLHELYFSGRIDGKILGHLSWRLSGLGVEDAEPFAVAPTTRSRRDQQSGRYQQKLDTAYGFKFDDNELYPIKVPMRDHLTGERDFDTVWIQPPHESMARELDEDEGVRRDWQDNIADPWIPAWEQHPRVRGATPEERRSMFGFSFYMDASRFQLRDALLIMTVRLLCSGKRHLVCALPKSSLCDCGCAGWCTLYPIYQAIYWSFEAGMNATKPLWRHDGGVLDEHRNDVAGLVCKYIFIALDYNGDWSEIAARWAFPTWGATLGCFLCRCSQLEMRDPLVDVIAKDPEEYFRDCTNCEIWVVVDTFALRMAIRFSLIDDSSRKGRVLKDDSSPLIRRAGLRKWDRLEPSPRMLDVFSFERLALPFLVKFWRIPDVSELTTHHRHPLITKELGTSIWTFGIDTLHGLHLGIVPAWCTTALMKCWEADIYCTRASRWKDHMKSNALAVMADLKHWYPVYEAGMSLAARRKVTRIQMVTASTLGHSDTGSAGFIDFKGQETRHFQPFVLNLIRKHKDRLCEFHGAGFDFNALEAAGQAIVDLEDVMAREPRNMSANGLRDLNNAIDRHILNCNLCGVHILPKHHMETFVLFSLGLWDTSTKPNSKLSPKIGRRVLGLNKIGFYKVLSDVSLK